MTILCDRDLRVMLDEGLIKNFDSSLVNPASIDIRIGNAAMTENGNWRRFEMPASGLALLPGRFALVETLETFEVPNGYAMDLRLKSSTARRGWNHSLAFWIDPGWKGRLTMEVQNVLRDTTLRLIPGERFAQVIVHKLSGLSEKPYAGRYNNATTVEGMKNG